MKVGAFRKLARRRAERIEAQLARHLIEQALEGEAHVDRAVAAERPARRRVGEHALADVLDVVQIVDGVEHRARIEDGDDAVARVRAAALGALALHRRDAPVSGQADLEADVGLGPAAVGDEGLLARRHDAHGAAGLAREQRRDQLDVEAFRAAAEAAADERLDDADPRHVHVEDLGQHQVHVVGDLGGGVHREPVAHGVVVGDRGVHLHLVLADLGAVVGRLAHQRGCGEAVGDAAQLEQHVALEIAGLLGVQRHGIGRQRRLRGEVGRQLAHVHFDQAHGGFRGRLVDGRNGGHRLALVAHLVARQRMLAARDGEDAEGLVAVGAGDDGDHARQLSCRRHVDGEDFRVRVGAAVDAPGQHLRGDKIGRIPGAARNLLGPVDHGYVSADRMPHGRLARDLVHGRLRAVPRGAPPPRGGRTQRHGLSSPMTTAEQAATGELVRWRCWWG